MATFASGSPASVYSSTAGTVPGELYTSRAECIGVLQPMPASHVPPTIRAVADLNTARDPPGYGMRSAVFGT